MEEVGTGSCIGEDWANNHDTYCQRDEKVDQGHQQEVAVASNDRHQLNAAGHTYDTDSVRCQDRAELHRPEDDAVGLFVVGLLTDSLLEGGAA